MNYDDYRLRNTDLARRVAQLELQLAKLTREFEDKQRPFSPREDWDDVDAFMRATFCAEPNQISLAEDDPDVLMEDSIAVMMEDAISDARKITAMSGECPVCGSHPGEYERDPFNEQMDIERGRVPVIWGKWAEYDPPLIRTLGETVEERAALDRAKEDLAQMFEAKLADYRRGLAEWCDNLLPFERSASRSPNGEDDEERN